MPRALALAQNGAGVTLHQRDTPAHEPRTHLGGRETGSPRSLLCFLHIEKTAGTTFQRILQQNFPSYLVLSPYLLPAEEADVFTAKEAKILLRALPFTRALGGHCVRSYLGYQEEIQRPVRYLTFLREPIARYLSHYYHQRRHGRCHTIRDFASESRFANLMTKKICGRYDVEAAKQTLQEDFAFVGLVERFDESLHLLRNQLGVPDSHIGYVKENVSGDPSYRDRDELSAPWVREAATEANELDLEVYQFACTELWPGYLSKYSGDLEADVAQFRAARPGFLHGPRWFTALRLYRHLGYRNLEMALRGLYHPDSQGPDSRIADACALLARPLRRSRHDASHAKAERR